MVAMLAFGGTFAYFTATTTAQSKEVQTGRVQLGANSTFTLTTKVVPGQELLVGDENKVTITSNSNVKTYVFVKFSVDITKATGEGYNTAVLKKVTAEPKAEGEYKLTPTVAADWKLVPDQTDVYYAVIEGAEASTPKDVCSSITFDGYSVSTEALKGSLMDATIKVTIDSSAAQYEGFGTDVAGAYAAATIDNK